MKEHTKKQLIVSLLFIACIISGYMFIAASPQSYQHLNKISKADSLIERELTNFNISQQQIRISSTILDSTFIRKWYHVKVPADFSKTQLHAGLNALFYPYDVKTPARVSFPEKNVNIYFSYKGTVIRTLSLQTDAEITHSKRIASILVTFNGMPDEESITQLRSLGEPIPIVLNIDNPLQAKELNKRLKRQYSHIIYWLQTSDGRDLMSVNPNTAKAKLRRLEKVFPEAHILNVNNTEDTNRRTTKKLLANSHLRFLSTSNAIFINDKMGKASFFESLDKLQNSPKRITAIIEGNETTLSWLQEKLPQLKKAGVKLIIPPQAKF